MKLAYWGASLTALAAFAAPAWAQPAQRPMASIDEIVVTATGLSSASSSTKTDTPIIESPQAISVISSEEIELRASPTIADALSYTAGVQAESMGADSRVDEVTVRGFGAGGFSSNNSFVDGLRLPAGGQWTRPGFDPFALQQIEVLKGPAGALYGQTAPGGVVNIVTKRPTGNRQGQIMLQGAGFSDLDRWNWQAAGDVGGPLKGGLSGRLVGLVRDGDTPVDQVSSSRYYLSPSLTWRPSDNTTWTLLAQYQRDRGGATFQFLPSLGALRPTNGGHIAGGANIGEPDWNTFDRDQQLLGSFLEHRFNDQLTFRNNSRYTYLKTLYQVVVLAADTLTACPGNIPGCIPGQTVTRRAVQGSGESDGWATDSQIELKVSTGAVQHTLLAGFDYFHTEWDHNRDGVAPALVLPVLNILDPRPRGAANYAANLTPQIYTQTTSSQTGLYIQDQIAVGGLRVTLGGRQDWTRDDTFNPVNGRRFITEPDAFSWRAGAVYLFDNGLAPYVSYAKSFLPLVSDPSTSVGGVPFTPTTGQQWEAGLRFQRGRSIYLTLGGYQITQQNLVTPEPTGRFCGPTICQVQTGEARVRGLEFEGKATLPWGMAVVAGVSRSDSEITRSNTPAQLGNQLGQIPRWLASVFVDQRIFSGPFAGVGFGGGLRYTGDSFGDVNNALAIPGYTLADLFVRYDFGQASPRLEGLTAGVNARNVADKRFVATCTAVSACYYGQGRSVTARLQYRW